MTLPHTIAVSLQPLRWVQRASSSATALADGMGGTMLLAYGPSRMSLIRRGTAPSPWIVRSVRCGAPAMARESREYTTSCASSPGTSAAVAETDADDWSSLEVEVLMPDEVPENAWGDASPSSTPAYEVRDHETAPHASYSAASVEVIDTVDTYAKAKVNNFVRRLQQPVEAGGGGGATLAPIEVREVQGMGGSRQFHARWKLPVPVEYGDRYGEGFASNAKDAEGVAAMHAERVIDSLGLQLFLLPSKQRKHAEAARAAGRWAPMPPINGAAPEVVPPFLTPSPPPLCLQTLTQLQQQERQLRIDHLQFIPVRRGGFTPLKYTLTSPHYIDTASVSRIQDFFAAHRSHFKRSLKLSLLRNSEERANPRDTANSWSSAESSPPSSSDLYVAKLDLPLPPRFGLRNGIGKAPSRKDAITLACMHAELIIDAVGLALYPNNKERQGQHRDECARVRRWCAGPGDCNYKYSIPSPPPLQLVTADSVVGLHTSTSTTSADPSACGAPLPSSSVDSRGATASLNHCTTAAFADKTSEADIHVGATSADSVESVLLQHQQAVNSVTYFTEEASLDAYDTTRLFLDRYLEQFGSPQGADHTAFDGVSSLSPFFVAGFGIRGSEVYRATATVPLVDSSSANDTSSTPLSYTQSFVAIGVATTAFQAEVAASLHALRTLAVLNRFTLHRGQASVSQAMESFADRNGFRCFDASKPLLYPHEVASAGVLPHPIRCVGNHVGRIVVPGLKADTRKHRRGADDAAGLFPRPLAFREQSNASRPLGSNDHLIQEVLRAQKKLPRLEWYLGEDAGGRIIIEPTASSKSGRNYVHTLPSARSPDAFAVNRLRDYMERHGMSLESSATMTVVRRPEEDLQEGSLIVVRVMLPLPHRHRTNEEGGSRRSLPSKCIAQGEAPNREEAQLLCAMHAELLLDAWGVPMYDHPALQRKHADTARMLGRWAPLVPFGFAPPVSLQQIPPPLRKVSHSSCLWARVVKERAAAARSNNEADPHSIDGSASTDVDDERLCAIEGLRYVHHTEIFRNALRYMTFFFSERGSDLYRALRQYNVIDAKHGVIHRAILEMPIPAIYGKRYAVGCADTKRNALHLCAAHALDVLDAFHIPLFTGKRLREYVRLSALKGRIVTKPGDAVMPPTTLTPPGLYFLETAETEDRPVMPHVPPRKIADSPGIWSTYLQKSTRYIKWKSELLRKETVHRQDPFLPHSGVGVEDAALDAVSQLPLDRKALHQLAELVEKACLPPVPPFRYESFGRQPQRYFLTTAPLLGTPYEMRGRSDHHGTDSKIRAAMHGCFLITQTVRQNLAHTPKARRPWRSEPPLPPFSTQSVAPHGTTTAEALVSTILMWSSLHHPPLALCISTREAIQQKKLENEDALTPLAHHTTALVKDADGRVLHSSTREGTQDAFAIRAGTICHLFGQLQRTATMKTLVRYLQLNPQLHIASLRVLHGEDAALSRIDSLLQSCHSTADVALRPTPIWPSKCPCNFGPSYNTWCTVELLKWVHSAAACAVHSSDPVTTPSHHFIASSLLPLFCIHGLYSTGAGLPYAPSSAAYAMAALCQCLPPLPTVAAPVVLKGSHGLMERDDRKLPIELARLVLTGMLLGCGRMAVRVAALIACAADVLAWRDGVQQGGRKKTPALASRQSIDVVALALEAASYPSSVLTYEGEVISRLQRLWTFHSADPSGSSFLWLHEVASWSLEPQLSDTISAAQLPILLRCAVVSATAPDVWVRAAVEKEDVVREDEVEKENRGMSVSSAEDNVLALWFKSRQKGHYAMLHWPPTDGAGDSGGALPLEKTDIPRNTAPFFFAAFSCVYVPSMESPLLTAAPVQNQSIGARASSADEEADEEDDAGDSEDGNDEDELSLVPGQALPFVRLLGTCVSPLTAVVAGAGTWDGRLRAANELPATHGSVTLFPAGDDLPMLLLAFNGTVPLVVHRSDSMRVLSRLHDLICRRYKNLTPLSSAERQSLELLLATDLSRRIDVQPAE